MRYKSRMPYYYIIIHGEDGKDFLDGAYHSEREAREKGFLKLKGVSFEVKSYPTHDLTEANRMFRHERLEATGDIYAATSRVKHKADDKYIEAQKRHQVNTPF